MKERKMPIEICETMSNEDYRKDKGISKSRLDRIHKSINHDLMKPSDPTPAMIQGSALHCAWLEPDLFDLNYVVEEKIDKRTTEGKVKDKQFQKENKNKTILTQKQRDSVQEMHDSLRKHPKVQNIFSSDNGKAEVSLFWDELDIRCKARPDWVFKNQLGLFLVDLKTTQDASPEGFRKSIANYRYHVQCAWYCRGAKVCYDEVPEGFIFVAVENKEPWNVGVYTLGLASRDEGWILADADLRKYKDWLDSPPEEKFEGYSQDIEQLEIPNWAFSN